MIAVVTLECTTIGSTWTRFYSTVVLHISLPVAVDVGHFGAAFMLIFPLGSYTNKYTYT